tara:strand:- start:1755 stop:2228 length:474 start_codon:yes stop_codon:yes gene_type:complete
MDANQTKIKLDVDKWNIKVRHRRNNRMRLQINLTKDEAIAYKNFADVCKPLDITEADFLKTVFITGIEALNKQLAEMVQKYAKENQEELAASGITVIEGEDGEVKLASTADLIQSELDVSGATSPIQPKNFLDKAQTADRLNEDADSDAPKKYEEKK